MSSIDIVVPCYGYGRYLEQCVGSLLSQDVANLRILVIDDASTDNTAVVGQQVAAADSRVTFVRHAKNKGHIATYNEGIEWAASEYLLLLSADDYLLDGALARAVRMMEANPKMALCYGNALEGFPDGTFRSSGTGFDLDPTDESLVLESADFLKSFQVSGSKNPVPTPTAVVRTRIQKQLGGYRYELPHTADLEQWLCLASRGSVGVIANNQAIYRRHANNMSLGYSGENKLLDLIQRQAAITSFCRSSRDVLPNADQLERRLVRPLGLEAIGHASEAFNRGAHGSVKQLIAYAREVHPGINRTSPWICLAAKRGMGARLSRSLLPAVRAVRSAARKCLGTVA